MICICTLTLYSVYFQEHFFLVVCVDVNSGNESVRLCAYCSTGFVLRGGSPQSKRNGTGSDQNSGDGSYEPFCCRCLCL